MKHALLTATMLAFIAGPNLAQSALAQSASDLGHSLTPMGAEQAASADGQIPAWTGGLTTANTGYKAGDPRLDPFAAEKPVLVITAANVDQYAAKLAEGTVAMIKTLPGYHVDAYPTHRTFAAPQFIYDNAILNASRAHLVEGGNGVSGAELSVPFPIPHNGQEAVWNHIHRWRAKLVERTTVNAITTPGGDYTLEKWHERIMFPYNTPGLANPEKYDSLFWQEVLEPPRIAGQLTLVQSFEDPSSKPRRAWTYNPGERRVRRAPEINYDTPVTNTDGLETVDDYDMYNGAIDRYDWQLKGKKEIYIPYNTYKLQLPGVKYSEIVKPAAVNPDLVRFELHRVWVVEGTLKPGFRHIYARRTFYIDEDSWQIAISDRYDSRGQLWRTALAFIEESPDVPVLGADGYEFVDLQAHRYLAQGLHSEEAQAPIFDNKAVTMADYTDEALRREGHR